MVERNLFLKTSLLYMDDTHDIHIDLSTTRIDVDNMQLIFDFMYLPPATSKDNPVYHAIIDVSNIKINESIHLPPS